MKKILLTLFILIATYLLVFVMRPTKKYIIEPAADVFAFMHHERHIGLGFKTERFSVSYQLQRTERTGTLSVQYPFSLKLGNNVTNVVLSKEGYFPFIGDIEKRSTVGATKRLGNQITLQKNEDYSSEALSVLLVKQYTKKFEQEKDTVTEHLRTRQSYLEQMYPAEVAERKKRRAHTSFQSINSHCLEQGTKILRVFHVSPKQYAILKKQQNTIVLSYCTQTDVIRNIEIGESNKTPLASIGENHHIHLYINETLTEYDTQGNQVSSKTNVISPEYHSWLTSMYVDTHRVIFAQIDSKSAVFVHEITQHATKTIPVPIMKRISKIFTSPDGSLMLFGALKGSFDYDLKVHGMKKKDSMPKGIVQISQESTAPTVIHKGVDSVGYSTKGFWTYHRDLYKESDEQSISLGYTKGLAQQNIAMYSWDNTVQVYDVRDANHHTAKLHAVDGESDTTLLYATGKENTAAGITMLSNPYATIE